MNSGCLGELSIALRKINFSALQSLLPADSLARHIRKSFFKGRTHGAFTARANLSGLIWSFFRAQFLSAHFPSVSHQGPPWKALTLGVSSPNYGSETHLLLPSALLHFHNTLGVLLSPIVKARSSKIYFCVASMFDISFGASQTSRRRPV